MIKYCIFDLDGTLLNTAATITHCVNRTLSKFGHRIVSVEECITFVGDGPRNLITRALEYRGDGGRTDVDEALAFYLKAYDYDPFYLTHPFDGVIEMLHTLRQRGVKVGVVSNKQHSSTVESVRFFFSDAVDGVVGSREGVPLKPSPESSLALLCELGGEPGECAFIGDSPQDVITGIALGALPIGVDWGYRSRESLLEAGAYRVVSDTEELLEVIGL